MNTQFTKVYLAGGFRSGWQDKVRAINGFLFLDPKQKERPNGVDLKMSLEEYGTWDFHMIRQADIVFVYAEKTNTSCIGLSVEAGYAKGLGKTVILVLEPNHETIKDAYLQFIRKASDVTFYDLQKGIDYLNTYMIK
jgi:nucleoside 2-deoxyribosyltransferase